MKAQMENISISHINTEMTFVNKFYKQYDIEDQEDYCYLCIGQYDTKYGLCLELINVYDYSQCRSLAKGWIQCDNPIQYTAQQIISISFDKCKKFGRVTCEQLKTQ